jgi:hypothetical protein
VVVKLSTENVEQIIAALKVADVYCSLEDLDMLNAATAHLCLRVIPHPSIDPGTVLVLRGEMSA